MSLKSDQIRGVLQGWYILSYTVSYLMFQIKFSSSLSYLMIATDKRYKIQDKIKVLTFWLFFFFKFKNICDFFQMSNYSSFTVNQKVKKITFRFRNGGYISVDLGLAESELKLYFIISTAKVTKDYLISYHI